LYRSVAGYKRSTPEFDSAKVFGRKHELLNTTQASSKQKAKTPHRSHACRNGNDFELDLGCYATSFKKFHRKGDERLHLSECSALTSDP
jgi:hypothetical protein